MKKLGFMFLVCIGVVSFLRWHENTNKDLKLFSEKSELLIATLNIKSPLLLQTNQHFIKQIADQKTAPSENKEASVSTSANNQRVSQLGNDASFLSVVENMDFPEGQEVARLKTPSGKQKIDYIDEQGNRLSKVISPEGVIVAEIFTAFDGVSMARTYFDDGEIHKVSYSPQKGKGYVLTYDENGQVLNQSEFENGKPHLNAKHLKVNKTNDNYTFD